MQYRGGGKKRKKQGVKKIKELAMIKATQIKEKKINTTKNTKLKQKRH